MTFRPSFFVLRCVHSSMVAFAIVSCSLSCSNVAPKWLVRSVTAVRRDAGFAAGPRARLPVRTRSCGGTHPPEVQAASRFYGIEVIVSLRTPLAASPSVHDQCRDRNPQLFGSSLGSKASLMILGGVEGFVHVLRLLWRVA